MKKVLFSAIAVLGIALANAKAQIVEQKEDFAPIAATWPVIKAGHAGTELVALVNPHNLPTSVVFIVDGKPYKQCDNISGSDAIPMVCLTSGLAGGMHNFQVMVMNAKGYQITGAEKFFFPTDIGKLAKAEEKSAEKGVDLNSAAKLHDPAIMSGVTASLNFWTHLPHQLDYFVDYFNSSGSGSGDQIGMLHADSISVLMDSTKVAFCNAINGQIHFTFSNLYSGDTYKSRIFAFNAAAGAIIWYPASNLCYYLATDFIATSSIGSADISCDRPKKEIYLHFIDNNDMQAFWTGAVDTVSTCNSPLAQGQGAIPNINIGKVHKQLDSLDLTQYLPWFPNKTYWVKLYLHNSTGIVDSVITSCTLHTGINELAAGESFATFPNPVKDVLNINSTVEGNFGLYDMTGREVRSERIKTGQTVLSRDNVLPGFYIYSLILKDGRIITGKMVFADE